MDVLYLGSRHGLNGFEQLAVVGGTGSATTILSGLSVGMQSSRGAWDNAKKSIEDEPHSWVIVVVLLGSMIWAISKSRKAIPDLE